MEHQGDDIFDKRESDVQKDIDFIDESICCKSEVQEGHTQTKRHAITIEDIKHSDELVQFYTGLLNYTIFHAMFTSIWQHGADKLKIDS